MARDFSAELSEFIKAVSGPLNPGETQLLRLEHGWQEFTDVVGTLLDDIDEEDRATELPRLKLQAVAAVQTALAGMQLRPFARVAVNAAVPSIVPVAIDALADKSSVAVKARDLWLVPAIDTGIRLLLRTRRGLAPDAPPIRLDDVNEAQGGGAQGGVRPIPIPQHQGGAQAGPPAGSQP